MTIVRPGDDHSTVAARLGLPQGPIAIDAVVVDAFANAGVGADALRSAILLARYDFSRTPRPIPVPGDHGIELHGRLGRDAFDLDRMVVGDVTYFGADADEMPHVSDQSRRTRKGMSRSEVDAIIGSDLSRILTTPAFRSRRSPVVRGAMSGPNSALHLEVERISTSI